MNDLGQYLKTARMKRGLSQLDVAKHLKLASGQCISDWERNRGSTIPVAALKRLILLYKMDVGQTFEFLLNYQLGRLQEKVTREFYEKEPKPTRRARRG
jgi:transcriptional regulator with XRE-family HTH domain